MARRECLQSIVDPTLVASHADIGGIQVGVRPLSLIETDRFADSNEMGSGTSDECLQNDLEECPCNERIEESLDGSCSVSKGSHEHLCEKDYGKRNEYGDKTGRQRGEDWLSVRISNRRIVGPAITHAVYLNEEWWSV